MTASPRHIDHLVLPVRDLDAAGDFYRHLGFQVGARNRHPWGTENRLVQFNLSFLELVTVGNSSAIPPHGPGHFSFGAFVQDYLDRREGLAMFVLDSTDAKADAMRFRQKGIGAFEPFFFERKGRKPDGSETQVAFTLAFAMDPEIPEASFFRCQQHFPENFWNPDFQIHSNTATGIRTVTLAVAKPSEHAAFLRDFTDADGTTDAQGSLHYALDKNGKLCVDASRDVSGFTSFEVAVSNLARTEEHLRQNSVTAERRNDALVVSAAEAFGVDIIFSQSK